MPAEGHHKARHSCLSWLRSCCPRKQPRSRTHTSRASTRPGRKHKAMAMLSCRRAAFWAIVACTLLRPAVSAVEDVAAQQCEKDGTCEDVAAARCVARTWLSGVTAGSLLPLGAPAVSTSCQPSHALLVPQASGSPATRLCACVRACVRVQHTSMRRRPTEVVCAMPLTT